MKDQDDIQSAADEDRAADAAKTDEQLWNEVSKQRSTTAQDREERGTYRAVDEDDVELDDNPPPSKDQEAKGQDDDKGDAEDDDSDAKNKGDAADSEPSIEELKAQNARLLQQFRSEQQRSQGTQRAYLKLLADKASAAAKKTARDNSPNEENTDFEAKLDAVQEEYGDVVGPLIDGFRDLQSRVTKLSLKEADTLEYIEAQLEDINAAQMDVLEKEHPDGLKTIASNANVFREWIEDQPKMYREIFEQNREYVTDGTAAALLISRFKTALHDADGSELEKPQPETSLDKKRQRQMDGARTTRSRGRQAASANPSPDSQDDEAWWDHIKRERASKRQR